MKLLYKNCFAFCFLLSHSMHADSLDNFASGLQSIASQSKKTGPEALKRFESFLQSNYQELYSFNKEIYKEFKKLLPEDFRVDSKFENVHVTDVNNTDFTFSGNVVFIPIAFHDNELAIKLLKKIKDPNAITFALQSSDIYWEYNLLGMAIMAGNLDIVKMIMETNKNQKNSACFFDKKYKKEVKPLQLAKNCYDGEKNKERQQKYEEIIKYLKNLQ